MTKYYDRSVDGWRRIAAVDWVMDDDGRFGVEIPRNALPADFNSWSVYERFGQDGCTVRVLSKNGE